ncbi:MAG: alanine racemase [Candidatus Geothermincolales bacterium]
MTTADFPARSLVRPTWALVDLDCIRHNVRLYRRLVGESCVIMAVVKADAYGHGDVAVARAALEAGAGRLGVALVEEAERLRRAGIKAPVHLLFEPPPTSARRVLELDLVPSVYSFPFLEALSREAARRGSRLPVHVKVDTGMHRVGAPPAEAFRLAVAAHRDPHLLLEGVYTHFAMASEPGHPFTRAQMEKFLHFLQDLEREGVRPLLRHAAASGAAAAHPETRLDMVRLGIAMYGLLPGESFRGRLDLRPAMSLRTRVCHLLRVEAGEGVSYGLTYRLARPSWIAVLPVGYADGLRRSLSNRWEVLIGGKTYPLAGTICMDLCMVDLGDDLYPVGQEVVVLGGYGEEEVGTERMAALLNTINYEVVCGIGARVPRLYRDGGRIIESDDVEDLSR